MSDGRKRVVVCADDFGLSERASQSVLALASMGAISATACLIDGAFSARHARALRATNISIGLHLNLTESLGGEMTMPLPAWMFCAVLRMGDRSRIAREIGRQLHKFEALLERAPDFVDGHEHVHQLPVIRDALLAELNRRYGRRVAIRSTVPAAFRGVKAAMIASLGGQSLQSSALRLGLRTNSDFAGVYRFTRSPPFEERMRSWLTTLAEGGLIMCHPEMPADGHSAREDEHRFLASAAWRSLRDELHVQLIGFES